MNLSDEKANTIIQLAIEIVESVPTELLPDKVAELVKEAAAISYPHDFNTLHLAGMAFRERNPMRIIDLARPEEGFSSEALVTRVCEHVDWKRGCFRVPTQFPQSQSESPTAKAAALDPSLAAAKGAGGRGGSAGSGS